MIFCWFFHWVLCFWLQLFFPFVNIFIIIYCIYSTLSFVYILCHIFKLVQFTKWLMFFHAQQFLIINWIWNTFTKRHIKMLLQIIKAIFNKSHFRLFSKIAALMVLICCARCASQTFLLIIDYLLASSIVDRNKINKNWR